MGGGWRVVGGGGEEVSSCTINCEYVMMCMCVRVSASVSACLRLRLRTHAHLPCPCVYFMHFFPPTRTHLLLQREPEPTDHNIAYKSEFAVRY